MQIHRGSERGGLIEGGVEEILTRVVSERTQGVSVALANMCETSVVDVKDGSTAMGQVNYCIDVGSKGSPPREINEA